MEKEVLVGIGESRAGRSGGEHLTPWPGVAWRSLCRSRAVGFSERSVSGSRTNLWGVGEGRLFYHESDSDSRGRASPLGRPNVLSSQIRGDF